MILTGAILQQRYVIRESIGRGGMADVFMAYDRRRQTQVAIKVLREDLVDDADFMRRFHREAQALAQLDHPNVVRFYSLEQQGHSAFMVLDFVRGVTLSRYLSDAGGILPLSEATIILRQIGSALHYAHEEGIVHRDVKPGNVMIREDGTSLLMDLGIARMADVATMTQGAVGTPAYMSPEQILGRDIDRRSDIYSLGVMLFQMVCGRRPFTGDEVGLTATGTVGRIREAHLHLSPPDPSRFNRALSPQAAQVILKALAKQPQNRWPDVPSFVAGWEQAVGQPSAGALRSVRPPARHNVSLAGHTTPVTPVAAPLDINPPKRSSTPVLLAVGAIVAVALIGMRFLLSPRNSTTIPTPLPAATSVQVSSPDIEATAEARAAEISLQTREAKATMQAIAYQRGQATTQALAATATAEASEKATQVAVTLQTTRTAAEVATRVAATAAVIDQQRQATVARQAAATATVQAAATATAVALPPPLPGDGMGTIVFTSWRDKNPEIYSMAADGSDLRRLTYFAGDDWSPSWSPDGQRILFTSSRNAPYEGVHNIYSMDRDGLHIRRLTTNQAWDDYGAWSPDGQYILFVSTADNNAEIFIMRADGTQVRRLTNNGSEDRKPVWSPDGRSILFFSNRSGSWQIYRMQVDGSGQTQLTSGPANNMNGAWSPDGHRIVFESDRNGDFDVFIMQANGTGVVQLTFDSANEGDAVWSPDGRAIAFRSDRSGGGDIYVMWADGSGATQLTRHGAKDEGPAWFGTSHGGCAVENTFAFLPDDVRSSLGCAIALASNTTITTQRFAGGWMVWMKSNDQIFVLPEGKTWRSFVNTWTPDYDVYSCEQARQAGNPLMGFGRVWCFNADVQADLGDALSGENPYNDALWQTFERGQVFSAAPTQVFVLYANGTWSVFP